MEKGHILARLLFFFLPKSRPREFKVRWQSSLQQRGDVKSENTHQAARVIPRFVVKKTSLRGPIGQVHELVRLVGVVDIENEIAVLRGRVVVDNQAMINRSEACDKHSPEVVTIEFGS